jgi:hypothetical protein
MADMNGAASGAAAGSTFGPWGTAIGAGIGLLGGFGDGGQGAAQQAAAQQLAFQQQMYQQQDPFSAGGNRAQYVPQLNNLMAGGYQGISNDPMFQWQQQQGQQQVQRGLAAHGMGASGAEQVALQQQGFGNASSFFNDQFNRLSGLSGANSGRTAPMQGMSPQVAGQFANLAQGNTAGFAGQLMTGLSGIFGTPNSNNPNGGTNMQGFQSGNSQSAINNAFA